LGVPILATCFSAVAIGRARVRGRGPGFQRAALDDYARVHGNGNQSRDFTYVDTVT